MESYGRKTYKFSRTLLILRIIIIALISAFGLVGCSLFGGGQSHTTIPTTQKSFAEKVRELKCGTTGKYGPGGVNEKLGTPDIESDGVFYYYGGDGYDELQKIEKQLEIIESKLLTVEDENEFDRLMRQANSLEEKAENLTYVCTTVMFDDNNYVSHVFYDTRYKKNGKTSKTVNSFNVVDSYIVYFKSTGEVVYTAEFTDGSYCLNKATAHTKNNVAVSDMEQKTVDIVWTDEYYDGYGCEVEFSFPKDGYYVFSAEHKILMMRDNAKVQNSDKRGVEIIEFRNGVKSVGEEAFTEMYSLERISVPASLESFALNALDGCNNLKTYESGNCLYVGNNDNEALVLLKPKNKAVTSVTVDAGTAVIADGAFDGCDKLTELSVAPENLKFASSGGCIINKAERTVVKGCKSSVIPTDGSVTKIAESAFKGCIGLTSLSIPESVTEIDIKTFAGCDGLNVLTVDRGNKVYSASGNCLINTIEKKLVFGCKTAVIPNDGSVNKIGEYAFAGRTGLYELDIPNRITEICDNAFTECDDLVRVTIPKSVKNIGYNAFEQYDRLTLFFECEEMYNYYPNVILNGDFYGYIMSVVWNYKNNDIDESGYIHAEIGGLLYALKDGEAYLLPQKRNLCGDVVIPEKVNYKGVGYSVSGFANEAFSGCNNITSLTIPDIESEAGAFDGCDGITKLTVITLNIEYGYYNVVDSIIAQNSEHLQNISFIGNGIVRRIIDMHGMCTSLTDIFIAKSVVTVVEDAFFGYGEKLTIYCEANEKPSLWSAYWNRIAYGYGYDDYIYAPVVWSSTGIPDKICM